MPRKFSGIFGACRTGTREHVLAFIHSGAGVNAKDRAGWTPLSLAADFNPHADVITALIDAGADVEARDAGGSTALMWAASMNPNPEVTVALLKGGANVNAADDGGRTALFFAAQDNPNPAVAAALIAAGAVNSGPGEIKSITVNANDSESETLTIDFAIELSESGELSVSVGPMPAATPPALDSNHFPPSVLFTGFKASGRTRLEKLAEDHKYIVRKSVSHGLTYVVGGYNAGPAKIADAKREGAMVMNEAEFVRLLDTGELPEQKE
jgi:hypothetical protein